MECEKSILWIRMESREDLVGCVLKLTKQFFLDLTDEEILQIKNNYNTEIFYLVIRFEEDGKTALRKYTNPLRVYFRGNKGNPDSGLEKSVFITSSEFIDIADMNPRKSLMELMNNEYFVVYETEDDIGNRHPKNKDHDINDWIPSRKRLSKYFEKQEKLRY